MNDAKLDIIFENDFRNAHSVLRLAQKAINENFKHIYDPQNPVDPKSGR
ncbi:MAG: hypothetical protein HQM10_09880 [Candidatus Riflebacteria bacterium]|nr:hypothetical protein [Candidatus Riflebacteria bacterium]